VHALIKELKLYPYDENDFTLMEVLDKYGYILLALILILAITLVILIHIKKLNRQLLMKTDEIEAFNMTLEQEVQERTRQLHLVNEKLKELANTDELTHIFNRRHFLQLAEQFFYTAKRNATELYILALDIDFFKQINDTYGHAVGDEILKLFCKTIQHIIRESDIFGRIGGEEFALCFPNTTKEGACTFAEKIRATIEKTHYYGNPDKPLHVTVSIGIAWYQEGDQTIHESIKRSDQALYKAKQNGRNQVQIA
jgi:diguanylate cyclase (GGDEF)-like protein